MNNMSQIMKQAKEMQDKMAEIQRKIESQEIEGSSGGGVIKVVINGKNEVKSVKIDESLINKEELEVLEDLLVAALNDANQKLKENAASQMSSLSDGMGLPPGMKLPFKMASSSLVELIGLFSKLPSLGSRSARRVVLHLLKKKNINSKIN